MFVITPVMDSLRSMDQGWSLCILTSVMCIAGCLLITVDVLYRVLFPNFSQRHQFTIQENSAFLVASLSLSAGSLIFTSMYRLLPEAKEYFDQVEGLDNYMVYLLGFYLLGIAICGGLNALIHACTSESIVHCVHDDDSHGNDHGHDIMHDTIDEMEDDEDDHTVAAVPRFSQVSTTTTGTLNTQPTFPPSSAETVQTVTMMNPAVADETTSLLASDRPMMQKKNSIIDLSLHKLKIAFHHDHSEGGQIGSCHGYDSFEKCVLMCNLNNCQHKKLANSKNGGADELPGTQDHPLHYCDLPSTENLLFLREQFHTAHVNERAGSVHDEHDHGDDQHAHSHSHAHVNGHSDVESHHHPHHHHITTPLSRLLSIGLQTMLAITLHKFPEGFIMYSTSKANPSLGLTIFLSLAIHNFVEGFTMCLPMYLALQSRWKAIMISGLIGGMAQPFGAFLGWLVFRDNDLKSTDTLNMLFGDLMALTSGFLTIIGFQMFASAIGFGGSQRFVLIWMTVGISLIGLSYILIGNVDL